MAATAMLDGIFKKGAQLDRSCRRPRSKLRIALTEWPDGGLVEDHELRPRQKRVIQRRIQAIAERLAAADWPHLQRAYRLSELVEDDEVDLTFDDVKRFRLFVVSMRLKQHVLAQDQNHLLHGVVGRNVQA